MWNDQQSYTESESCEMTNKIIQEVSCKMTDKITQKASDVKWQTKLYRKWIVWNDQQN